MIEEFPEEWGAPVFFMSYRRVKAPTQWAAPPRAPGREVGQFFHDLTEDVNELVGAQPGRDPGYLDVAGSGGSEWQKRLLRAVGTCQVLVCLLSEPYLRDSPWCAREWDTFARRRVLPRTKDSEPDQTAIVPVIWTPMTGRLPDLVAEVGLFIPTDLPERDFEAAYLNYGLLGLIRTGQDRVYRTIVWKLAMHVARIHHLYRVETGIPDGIEGLRTTFECRGE